MKTSNLTLGLLGDSGSGKTSIFSRFVYGKFIENALSTISIDYAFKNVELKNKNCNIKLKLIDTSGQERYRPLISSSLKNMDIFIIVYNITDRKSFHVLTEWNTIINNYIRDKDKFLVILGNKTDLEEYREITTEEGKNYAKDINALFFEISTKTKKDIEEVFNIICEEYIEAHP